MCSTAAPAPRALWRRGGSAPDSAPGASSRPSLRGQVARVRRLSRETPHSSLHPAEILPLFWTHSSRPEERGGGGKSFESPTVTKLRGSTLAPQLSPAPGEASAAASPRRGPAGPLAPPPDTLEGGGRQPLPTENSHFFAARFRTTPGLMPSGELCNQGHRSRAKQTRLCVCSGGPGGAHRAGRGSGRASESGLFAQRNWPEAAGREPGAANVPGPALSRGPATSGLPGPRPLPHRDRPRLQEVNLVPSPAGRRHRQLAAGATSGLGGLEVLDSSPGCVPSGGPSVTFLTPPRDPRAAARGCEGK